MKYLVVQDWESTHGNHAGMVHMCKMLVEAYPNKYQMIVQQYPFDSKADRTISKSIYNYIRTHRPFRRLAPRFRQLIIDHRNKHVIEELCRKLRGDDEVFLLEYMLYESFQNVIAGYLKKHYKDVRVYALSHLTPSKYESLEHERHINIREWECLTDKMLTLGTSLSNYLIKNGVDKNKISTGFHYVDNTYYKPLRPTLSLGNNYRLKAIVIGAMQRNNELVAHIVKKCPEIDWIICKGHQNVDYLYEGASNVILKGFMTEEELRDQMDMADISVNVMDDTVGSNVITTSMAMGKAMLVSDVGSIRDYCTKGNAIFCNNNTNEFVSAIRVIERNRHKLEMMKEESISLSKKFSIEKVDEWFSSLSK